jgi:predicted  nucleic acid-binding Zn-ribbon protein
MPHICIRCKNRLEAVPGQAPRCPVCGGTKFSFIAAGKGENSPAVQKSQEISEIVAPETIRNETRGEIPAERDQDINDSIESIRILEPGRYDLNLLRLAESDDRVISVGTDGKYRLDLNSMMRMKKKKN